MFPQKSLRARFALQLASASTMLIVIFSVMLYHYIKITIFENIVQSLTIEANNILDSKELLQIGELEFYYPQSQNLTVIGVEENTDNLSRPKFIQSEDENSTYLTLYYPYKDNMVLALKKNTTEYSSVVNQVLVDILIINATAIFLILFYALFLSRMLLLPIKMLSLRLGQLNERFLQEVSIDELPDEFKPLGDGINRLISRILTFVQYQKELFVGAAHELKTPLAVMKTKNEVTLIKQREPEKYIEALKNNNESINQMNKMIGSILEIGRQEGAQFEQPLNVDIIAYLNEIGNNFLILAKGEGKNIKMSLKPQTLKMFLQPTLFLHVIQNFVQNAIKFSPPNATIEIKSNLLNNEFIVKVVDEGPGIDENKDLFAPFKRYGDKGGAGLGLFLAKGAAQALGGRIEIRNRTDRSGAIATFILPINTKNRKMQKNISNSKFLK
ncbi:HAMP domain-containing histidine kinase [Campylobacter fetus subsp. fetus]|uniref:histidine kinase n=4 Tax=Campylobacter fetus TaxID=196 RepID=A0AAE6IXB9_CAMFE|nr:two-component system sensor histidine kinase [Campylobacter fetus subsp. venerealis cfvi03/293]AIR79912.1 two-component system sensor histidine kinase [Campylobacter fetus subsp. venerealis 97/608]QEL44230.1 two-component system sensor histidine kinase [Campylobacter fetus subsp. venerealis NCTC 10354]QYA60884.1 HAMP domain-containing histidine kinase [Campylobacter fetus subsp. fetus]QYA64364.1 HAMP domain-containing histidine kinase [Campylobacter fetus subsp. fetus]